MRFSYKPSVLLTALLVSLAFSPCWAIPGPPETPVKPDPGKPVPPDAPPRHGGQGTLKVTRYLSDWMRSQRDKLTMAPYTKGGIESWVQFEFEYAIKKFMKIPIETIVPFREQHVYEKSSLAADWVFKSDIEQSTVSTRGLIVELKVESSTQTGKTFVDAVKKDQQKISGGILPAYKGYETAVLAIAWNKDTKSQLEAKDNKEDSEMVAIAGAVIKLHDGRTIQLYEWTNPGTNKRPAGSTLPFRPAA